MSIQTNEQTDILIDQVTDIQGDFLDHWGIETELIHRTKYEKLSLLALQLALGEWIFQRRNRTAPVKRLSPAESKKLLGEINDRLREIGLNRAYYGLLKIWAPEG